MATQNAARKVEVQQGGKTLSRECYNKVVEKAKVALDEHPSESFDQVKARVLRSFTRSPEYKLIKENIERIIRSANYNRFQELVAIAIELIVKYEGNLIAEVKKSGKKDFFTFIQDETMIVCQDDKDFNRVLEIIGPVVGTALRLKREMNQEEKRQKERDLLYANAGKDVAAYAAEHPVMILGEPSSVGHIILKTMKSEATQGMLRRQVIKMVEKMTKQQKYDILWPVAQSAVEEFFKSFPKDLFRKEETKDQFKELCERVRLSDENLVFVGKRYEAFVTISRAIMIKRERVATTFRNKQKESLRDEGLARINAFKKKTGPNKPGSARRRHASRFPNGQYPAQQKEKKGK